MYNIKIIFEKGRVLFNGKDLIGTGLRNNLYEISFSVARWVFEHGNRGKNKTGIKDTDNNKLYKFKEIDRV